MTNEEKLKYLVEQKRNETLFEGKCEVGLLVSTMSTASGGAWLDDKSPVELKDKTVNFLR